MNTKKLARIGILGALSAVLYAIPGIPVFPPIYKIDFSTLPALLGGMTMGPVASLCVLLIKDLTGLFHSSSMGVGELADFLMSGAMCVVLSLVYRKVRKYKGALWGMILGILAMTVMGCIANYYIMIPFYVQVMHLPEETIVGMMAEIIPSVKDIGTMVLYIVTPFNLLKGAVLAIITLLLYNPLHGILEKN